MLVVSPELGICAFQGRISVCLWPLDAVGIVSKAFSTSCHARELIEATRRLDPGAKGLRGATYPFR
jgi:hypothetical protein